MLDPTDIKISVAQENSAVSILNDILHAVGDPGTRQVKIIDMCRLIAFMAGAVIEADEGLASPAQFDRAGRYIGELVAHHAKTIRNGRMDDEPGVIARAIAMDDDFMPDSIQAGSRS